MGQKAERCLIDEISSRIEPLGICWGLVEWILRIKAVDELRFSYDLHPQDEEAAYWLGMAYFQAGNYDSTLATFLALNNLKGTILVDDAPLLIPLTARRIAQCYERLGNAKEAEPYNSEARKIWEHADDSVRQIL